MAVVSGHLGGKDRNEMSQRSVQIVQKPFVSILYPGNSDYHPSPFFTTIGSFHLFNTGLLIRAREEIGNQEYIPGE